MSVLVAMGGEPLQLKGFPEGKTRIRIRPNSFTTVFVRPPEGGIREFAIEEKDGYWCPAFEVGRNIQL